MSHEDLLHTKIPRTTKDTEEVSLRRGGVDDGSLSITAIEDGPVDRHIEGSEGRLKAKDLKLRDELSPELIETIVFKLLFETR